MYQYYTTNYTDKNNFETTENIVGFDILRIQKQLPKNEGYFINTNKIRKIKFINNPIEYPNGLYLLFPTNDNRKSLYFVFPTEKQIAHNKSIFTGDHFRFLWDKGDLDRPIHIHATDYTPLFRSPNEGFFRNYQINNIANEIDLPISDYNTNAFQDMQPNHNDILDISRKYNSIKNLTGGTGVARTRSTTISNSLKNILLEMNIISLLSFGIKHGNIYDFSVFIEAIDIESESENDNESISDYSLSPCPSGIYFTIEDTTRNLYKSFEKSIVDILSEYKSKNL
jgi:hypothetical protein